MSAVRTVAVVLSWNDAPRVTRLLRQLRASRVRPDAVVVVDNGSSDGSPATIAAAFPEHDVVRLDSNLGYAAAANVGLRRALDSGADWAWLLNTDIELPPDALACLLEAVATSARPVSVGMAAAVLVERDGRVQAYGGGRVSLRTGIAKHAARPVAHWDYFPGACLLVRARMLREVGLFDEGYFFYWEDVDLGVRARSAGWQLAVAGGCRVVHDEGSALGRWSAERWYHLFRGMRRFLDRHAPAPRLAEALRFAHHAATMSRHRRWQAVAGAWRAISEPRTPRRNRTRRAESAAASASRVTIVPG
jgi:GT2 family glycosyltransferase